MEVAHMDKDHPNGGCRVASSCLSCPAETCILDDPKAFQQQEVRDRHVKIWAELRKGYSVTQVATMLHRSVRQVRRVKAAGFPEGR